MRETHVPTCSGRVLLAACRVHCPGIPHLTSHTVVSSCKMCPLMRANHVEDVLRFTSLQFSHAVQHAPERGFCDGAGRRHGAFSAPLSPSISFVWPRAGERAAFQSGLFALRLCVCSADSPRTAQASHDHAHTPIAAEACRRGHLMPPGSPRPATRHRRRLSANRP